MGSESNNSTQGKRGILNSAVTATLIGILVSGMLGFLGYLQHERAIQLEAERVSNQSIADQTKYAKQTDSELARYIQGLQVKLYMQYMKADTMEDLVRFEHSLEWLEKDSPYEPTLAIVNSLRNFIKSDLEKKLREHSKESTQKATKVSKEKIALAQAKQTIAKIESTSHEQIIQQKEMGVLIEAKIKKDAKIQAADAMAIKRTTGDDRRKMALEEIICINPQSNWPKNCDEIYLVVNNKRIWKDPRTICRGERMRLDDKLFFDDKTVLDLWEYDRTQDDSLGQFRFAENLSGSDGTADIKGDGNRGRWHYVIKFKAD